MSQSFEIEGKVKVLLDLQTFDSGFSKREFVIEVEDGQYPQMVKFECIRDKAQILDGLSIDELVKVRFDVRGNEYKGKYYVNLNAWKIDKLSQDGSQDDRQTGDSDGPSTEDVDKYIDSQATEEEPPF